MATEQQQIEGLTKAVNKALTRLRTIGDSIDVNSEEEAELHLAVSECHDELKVASRGALGLENTSS